jgi:very-short-patch-repair endonuclease
MPKPEVILWSKLRGRQIGNAKFRRQYSVGPFILDFYCPELKLAIELDGESHFHGHAPAYDATRQRYIEKFGIGVLRFTNVDLRDNLEGLLQTVYHKVEELRQAAR